MIDNSKRARGIDVSHHQPTIDWQAVHAAGISFVGIKATEGLFGVDPKLSSHRSGFRSQPFTLGMYYHFARPGSAKAQAMKLFDAVGPLAPNERFVLDLEEGGPLMNGPKTIAWIEEFLTALAQPHAILYTSARVWKLFGNPAWGDATKYVDLWLPRYTLMNEPEVPLPWIQLTEGDPVEVNAHGQWVPATVTAIDHKTITIVYFDNEVTRSLADDEGTLWRRSRPKWTFWQWTDGKSPAGVLPVPGVGACDQNVFWSDEAALADYADPSPGRLVAER